MEDGPSLVGRNWETNMTDSGTPVSGSVNARVCGFDGQRRWSDNLGCMDGPGPFGGTPRRKLEAAGSEKRERQVLACSGKSKIWEKVKTVAGRLEGFHEFSF
jgi:hypothetical protein